MQDTTTDTDVLIVGAGPVGLFLANECARRDLNWQIVEKRPAQSVHSKALAIFPRTLEILDMAGLADPFLAAAHRVTSVEVAAHGRVLAHMPFTPEESPYPFIAMVPQNRTEKLLVDQLAERGGAIEYETSFVSAVQHADHVRVTLDHNGQRRELTVRFVVGCDGAHSAVRHHLDLPFDGAEYHDQFLLADIETNEGLPADQLQLCPNEAGPLAIFPMSATRRRIVATVREATGEAPSLELVRQILEERAPAGLEAYSLYWSSYFRIHHRNVTQLRSGRFFLAGDAAHIHSPFGGQGMNTGLHDAWNLVWKLDLFLKGKGNEQLLDSYSTERLPVIKHVVEITDFLTRAMATPSKFAQSLRDTVIPMVSRLVPFQHAFVEVLSELGVSYHGSPIVEGPGKRYLDDSMRGGDGIGSRFLLLLGRDVDSLIAEKAGRIAEALEGAVAIRSAPGRGVMLVRPDGYIAFSKRDAVDMSDLTSVRILLEVQVSPAKRMAIA
ncbi:MAG: FAD-dependent monooxygenase [Chromatiaceae bacterium]|nr:FAD-dependent monooxygenase [Chromatiaceae bacterium]MCP5314467.1 FAD-dependent monooxygenase [Chromatiaceae bacterium]